MDYEENIAEYPVTEWRGARVMVRLDMPRRANTITSQIILSEDDLSYLDGLKRPADLDLMSGLQMQLALTEWDQKKKQANRMVESISNKIAMDLVGFYLKEDKQ